MSTVCSCAPQLTRLVNDTRISYRWYQHRYFLLKLSAIPIPILLQKLSTILLPILFVVVIICAHIFTSLPFLVTKTIFSNECHIQQKNMKLRKVCYKFQTAQVPCNYSALQWLSDYMRHMVCVTKICSQQPPMTSESNSHGLADGCWCWPVHCGTTGLITPMTVCDSISYTGSWELPLSIGNTLSILLSKSIADNTVDIWKEAAKIHRR